MNGRRANPCTCKRRQGDDDEARCRSAFGCGARAPVARSELCRPANPVQSTFHAVSRCRPFGTACSICHLVPRACSMAKACLKLLPESPGCDWRVELTRAEKWGPADQLLLVVLNANHETGSGATDSVFLYACQRGTSVPVFSRRYLYGATVAMGQNSDLWITSGVWRPADPQCCPSRERREHYTWNKAKGASFLLEHGSPGCAGCDRVGLTNQEVGSAAAIGQPRMF